MKTVAIVGATGAVGQEFRNVLRERRFPAQRYILLASARSAGKQVEWTDGPLTIETLTPDSFRGVDLALFSAGGAISKEYGPIAARAGTVVVDNSSAFRMDPAVPLVVPEVNPHVLKPLGGRALSRGRGEGPAESNTVERGRDTVAHSTGRDGAAHSRGCIIANPNCSTIILAVALWPLHKAFTARRVVVSTYQAASGAGAKALEELESQSRAVLAGETPRPEVFPVPCAFNVFSHNSAMGADGYNLEETKMLLETRKIFGDPSIRVTATCMRVPVMRAHTEAVNVEFEQPVEPAAARELLAQAPGVCVVDDPAANRFPTPLDASGRDEVLVGRIRRDPTVDGGRGLSFICSGDQLRKGAALNAVQIAELLLK